MHAIVKKIDGTLLVCRPQVGDNPALFYIIATLHKRDASTPFFKDKGPKGRIIVTDNSRWYVTLPRNDDGIHEIFATCNNNFNAARLLEAANVKE